MSSPKPNRDFQRKPEDQNTEPPERPINTELVEHRLNEFDYDIKEIKRETKDIDTKVGELKADVREIKTDMKHMATRAWILGGILGGMGVAALIAVGVLKLFF